VRRLATLSSLPLSLLVHHAEDGCPICPYPLARSLAENRPFVTVRGGSPPKSDPCGPLAAPGYLGREAETAAAIRDRILERPVPKEVP
jgi:hypothetical protein